MNILKNLSMATVGAVFIALGSGKVAEALTFATGDVFAGVGNGYIKQFDNNGNLKDTLDSGYRNAATTGMAFDSSGNLYTTLFGANQIVKFNNQGIRVGTFGSGFSANPESILFDRSGNAYVGQADGSRDVLKFDSNGSLLATYNVPTTRRGSDWIDLAADQRTLRYTSEGNSVLAFDVVTNTPLPNFATTGLNQAFAHRILADGGSLVANRSDVKRFDATGNVVQTYTIPDGILPNFFALNIDPDNQSFFTAGYDSGNVYKVNIATGNVTTSFNAGVVGSNTLAGLAVYGEITEGGIPPTTPIPFEFSPSLGILLLGTGGAIAQIKSLVQKRKSSESASLHR